MTKSEYNNIHSRLRKKNGSASRCENKHCVHKNPKRFEWALKKGSEYSDRKEDYIQLCCSCHRKYDDKIETRQKLSKLHKGKICHNRSRKVEQLDYSGKVLNEFDSIANAGRSTGILRTSIQNCVQNVSLKSGGFLWRYKK